MSRSVGGPITGPTLTCVPKSGYTPVKDDLVIWDTTINFAMDQCAQDENPNGKVIWVAPDSSYFTTELYAGGMIATLPYSVAPSRGDKIERGAVANQVRTDNSNGVGTVVAVDRVSGYVDVYFS